MIRLGMHSSLWTSAWTREGAELSVADAARHGLEVVEIALLSPTRSMSPIPSNCSNGTMLRQPPR